MSKEKAIAKIIPVFRQYGYEGTTLSMLSTATGLGKASLYHYFPQGKEAIAAAVLNYIGSSFSKTVLKPLKDLGKPNEKIDRMCQSLNEFYSEGNNSCFLAIMSFGEADNLFHQEVKQLLQIWIDTLAKVLIEAGFEPEQAQLRSQDAIIQIQGALILVRILDDTAPFKRVIATLSEKLLKA
ncbi:TetR/AcrR family transcriptional regulator [Myxosarcina sp. GI1]|uniref:TetR/AcrR family transcriptional regulator n=1 Tax=Myxosarcina sp. GI1 TaxID=1541065 RepID=UPI0005648384|nr:TetR/AcrR family transcriptional regulator [Myxosarcina sp. GI1]